MYPPLASVSAVRVPNWDVAMITAPGMPRPVGSTTFPAMVPVVNSCARVGVTVARSMQNSAAHEETLLFILDPPNFSTPRPDIDADAQRSRPDPPGEVNASGITQSQYKVRVSERKSGAGIIEGALRNGDRPGDAAVRGSGRVAQKGRAARRSRASAESILSRLSHSPRARSGWCSARSARPSW